MLHALVNFKVGKVEIEKKKKNLWRSLTSQPRLLSKVYVNQRLCLKTISHGLHTHLHT